MNTREMWAPREWQDCDWFIAGSANVDGRVCVLVQEIPDGAPTLSPKDTVRHVRTLEEMEVTSRPFWSDFHGEWRVEVSKADYHYATVGCKNLALRPPETSRLIRLTGPEDAVEKFADWVDIHGRAHGTKVRVEVVDG